MLVSSFLENMREDGWEGGLNVFAQLLEEETQIWVFFFRLSIQRSLSLKRTTSKKEIERGECVWLVDEAGG